MGLLMREMEDRYNDNKFAQNISPSHFSNDTKVYDSSSEMNYSLEGYISPRNKTISKEWSSDKKFRHSSPSSSSSHPEEIGSTDVPLCAGCRLRIDDKFYLQSVERKWHAACLRCAECGGELENQRSCFETQGLIYCKDDYLKIYLNSKQTCTKCCQEIETNELVLKLNDFFFHIDCFRCEACHCLLEKGTLCGMSECLVYCQYHYKSNIAESSPTNFSSAPENWMYPHPENWYPPISHDYPGQNYGSSSEFPFDTNGNEPHLKKRRGRKKRKVESFSAGYLDPITGFPPPGLEGPGPKTKRARTSFKHHQLRIMKGHFQINQNPDSRELKMLSSRTGLDKKVLQVWFQNSRAKWRRTKTTDGLPGTTTVPVPSGSGGSGLNDESAMDTTSSPSSDCSGSMIQCC